ncbi:MAG: hypothetical protein R3D83_07925 [Caenibius sp.]
MRIEPALWAMRTNDEAQRQAQHAMVEAAAAWRQQSCWRDVAAGIRVFGEGAGLAQCPALVTLFAPDGAGQKLARAFVEHFLAVLAREPLAQVPSRYSANGSVMTLMLAASGRATLSLVLFDGARLAERPAPQSAGFAEGERRELVIAGRGEGRLVERAHSDGPLSSRLLHFQPGQILDIDTARQALLVERVDGAMVTLRRCCEPGGPSREYALSDGRLVHQSAGTIGESAQELMLALLGRMKRADAVPLMADERGRRELALAGTARMPCTG